MMTVKVLVQTEPGTGRRRTGRLSAGVGPVFAGRQIGLSLRETRLGESDGGNGGVALAVLAELRETSQRETSGSGLHCCAAECAAWDSVRSPSWSDATVRCLTLESTLRSISD